MDVTKLNSRSLVDFIDNAEKLYSKPIGGYKSKDVIEKYLPLVINKVGFYGERKGDEIYWLPNRKTEFNSSENVVITIEGEVNLTKVPVNNGSGSLSYEGNGSLKVNGSVVYGGSDSTTSELPSFTEDIVFSDNQHVEHNQTSAITYTLNATQPTGGEHYRTDVINSNGDAINLPAGIDVRGDTIDTSKTNILNFQYLGWKSGTIEEKTTVIIQTRDLPQ